VLYAFDLLMLQGKDVRLKDARLGRSNSAAKSSANCPAVCETDSDILKPSTSRYRAGFSTLNRRSLSQQLGPLHQTH